MKRPIYYNGKYSKWVGASSGYIIINNRKFSNSFIKTNNNSIKFKGYSYLIELSYSKNFSKGDIKTK